MDVLYIRSSFQVLRTLYLFKNNVDVSLLKGIFYSSLFYVHLNSLLLDIPRYRVLRTEYIVG